MGLFDKLKKDLLDMAKKTITDIIEDKLDVDTSPDSSTTPYKEPAKPVPAGAPAADAYAFRGTAEEYFAKILSGCFPQYEVQRQVRIAEEGTDSIPLTFQLCQQGQPVLAVIVCDKHLYGYKRFRNTVNACKLKGLPVQCYYTQFRNEANYVTERLGQVLQH